MTGDPAELAGDLAGALLERGEHFTIGACYGEVLLGREAHSAEEALRIADQRLYAQKLLSARPPASREWRDVLLGLLRERDPELDTHVHEVAALAQGVGERLGLAAADLADLVAAAELHDIGKAAIPDAILDKPEALDREERTFIERHTIIGERIIASAPSLRAESPRSCAPRTSATTGTAIPTGSQASRSPSRRGSSRSATPTRR